MPGKKSEIRNTKFETNSNQEMIETLAPNAASALPISCFPFRALSSSNFDIRISNFPLQIAQ